MQYDCFAHDKHRQGVSLAPSRSSRASVPHFSSLFNVVHLSTVIVSIISKISKS